MRVAKWITINRVALLALGLGCGGQSSYGASLTGPTAATSAPGVDSMRAPEVSGFVNTPPVVYALSSDATGVSEVVNNIANLTVVSRDRQVLKAEYQAGFIQGHMQGKSIRDARDNAWVGLLYDGSEMPVDQVVVVNSIVNQNFNFFLHYLRTAPDRQAARGLTRLLFRMLGIYHGATRAHPANLDFSGRFLPDASYFRPGELVTGYGTPALTFMDVYFTNAVEDVTDVYWNLPAPEATEAAAATTLTAARAAPAHRIPRNPFWRNVNPLRCSAFLKRAKNGELILAHNSWFWFLSQTMSMTIDVNGDRVSMNTHSPGLIGSLTDFGFNNKGLMFNETTNAYGYTEAKADGIFIFWRAALAEELAGSLDEFFHDISIDNTGTYMNAYMVADANSGEMGLVDMSYKSFVFFRSNGGPYTVTTLPPGQAADYDTTMVTPDYILGFNYPPSALVQSELQASPPDWVDRVTELGLLVPDVEDVASAKAVITNTDPQPRGAIYSRFDLADENGIPIGPHPEYGIAPFGAIDAKVVTATMVRQANRLSGTIDLASPASSFWMRWGTPYYEGKPFIWSESAFASWPHPGVPNVLGGTFTRLKLHLK